MNCPESPLTAHSKIGEWLAERGLVGRGALDELAACARQTGQRLLSHVLERGLATERDLVDALAAQRGLGGIALESSTLLLGQLELVPRAVAEKDGMLPVSCAGGRLLVAVAEPSAEVLDELRFITLLDVVPVIALEGPLRRAIAGAYAARERGEQVFSGPRAAGSGLDLCGAQPETQVEIHVGALDPGEEVLTTVSVQCGEKRRILVADDEPEICELMSMWLEARGYSVTTAADGNEALAAVEAGRFDLALLDAMMPGVHGFDVCVRIKARWPTMPVLMMSAVYRGWRIAEDVRESLRADDYLEKPFRLEEVLRRIEQHLPADDAAARRMRSLELYRRGLEQLGARNYKWAAATFQEALREHPDSARAHYQLARCLQEEQQVYPAMHHFERAIDLQPSMFSASRSLAGLYLSRGFERKAAEVLERALRTARDEATRRMVKKDLLQLLEADGAPRELAWPEARASGR